MRFCGTYEGFLDKFVEFVFVVQEFFDDVSGRHDGIWIVVLKQKQHF